VSIHSLAGAGSGPQLLSTLLREARATLAGADARAEIELLAAHAFGLTRAQLVAGGEHPAEPNAAQRFREWVARRARGEPIAYLLGTRGFWTLELLVTPAVLIPRHETELLVELALARMPAGTATRVADLGTGSGAIALALARERPQARVVATDASEPALDVARRNAQRHAITNVEFRHGSWFDAVAGRRFDLIVSNPPYVAERDPHLGQGDCRYEPASALASGGDGLDAIRHLVARAPAHLERGGWLLLEHGYDQAGAVRELFDRHGAYADSSSATDLGGHERVTAARLSAVA